MVKFADLKCEQLKKELLKLELATAGTKAELQKRLTEAFAEQGLDVNDHEFEMDTKVATVEASAAPDLNALMQFMQQNFAQIKQNSEETAARMQEQMKRNSEETAARIESKLQQIASTLTKRVDDIENELASVKRQLITLDIKDAVEGKLSILEQRIRSLERGGSATAPAKIKPPTFDGSTPFNTFKFQFETAIALNRTTGDDAVATLIVSLKGPAAEVLQTVPMSERGDYEAIMEALRRRYGSDHLVQLHRIKLRNRSQGNTESLQEFAADIERLAYLSYPNESSDLFERLKIEAFANGIRDPETKLEVLKAPKNTLAETISVALTQEAIRLSCRPVFEDRRAKTQHVPSLKEFGGKCYTCGKKGHMSRQCQSRRKLAAPVESQSKRKSEPKEDKESLVDVRLCRILPGKGSGQGNTDARWRRPGAMGGGHRCVTKDKKGFVDERLRSIRPKDEWSTATTIMEQRNDSDLADIIRL